MFREFGPLAGNTMRVSYEIAPKIGNTLSRQTADIDARYYQRLGATGLLALRARALPAAGAWRPTSCISAATRRCAATSISQFVGDHAAFFNAELRFPLIEAMLTPIGILGGIRGVFFANLGGGHFEGQPFKWFSNEAPRSIHRSSAISQINFTQQEPIYGTPTTVERSAAGGCARILRHRPRDFALGFPIHFDYSWKTLFNKDWEDLMFAAFGGSSWFREPEFTVWIGYDF